MDDDVTHVDAPRPARMQRAKGKARDAARAARGKPSAFESAPIVRKKHAVVGQRDKGRKQRSAIIKYAHARAYPYAPVPVPAAAFVTPHESRGTCAGCGLRPVAVWSLWGWGALRPQLFIFFSRW